MARLTPQGWGNNRNMEEMSITTLLLLIKAPSGGHLHRLGETPSKENVMSASHLSAFLSLDIPSKLPKDVGTAYTKLHKRYVQAMEVIQVRTLPLLGSKLVDNGLDFHASGCSGTQ
jgi:hypothetical protein